MNMSQTKKNNLSNTTRRTAIVVFLVLGGLLWLADTFWGILHGCARKWSKTDSTRNPETHKGSWQLDIHSLEGKTKMEAIAKILCKLTPQGAELLFVATGTLVVTIITIFKGMGWQSQSHLPQSF